jgi:hypothetical protein
LDSQSFAMKIRAHGIVNQLLELLSNENDDICVSLILLSLCIVFKKSCCFNETLQHFEIICKVLISFKNSLFLPKTKKEIQMVADIKVISAESGLDITNHSISDYCIYLLSLSSESNVSCKLIILNSLSSFVADKQTCPEALKKIIKILQSISINWEGGEGKCHILECLLIRICQDLYFNDNIDDIKWENILMCIQMLIRSHSLVMHSFGCLNCGNLFELLSLIIYDSVNHSIHSHKKPAPSFLSFQCGYASLCLLIYILEDHDNIKKSIKDFKVSKLIENSISSFNSLWENIHENIEEKKEKGVNIDNQLILLSFLSYLLGWIKLKIIDENNDKFSLKGFPNLSNIKVTLERFISSHVLDVDKNDASVDFKGTISSFHNLFLEIENAINPI